MGEGGVGVRREGGEMMGWERGGVEGERRRGGERGDGGVGEGGGEERRELKDLFLLFHLFTHNLFPLFRFRSHGCDGCRWM